MDQEYLMVNNSTNIVENNIIWNGNPNTWSPPDGYTMLIKSTTPAKIWEVDYELTPPDFVLIERIGAGEIGFIWNDSFLMTNQSKPVIEAAVPADNQPETTGTQTL